MPDGADASVRYTASLINLPPTLYILVSGDAAATVKDLLPEDPSIHYHTQPGQYFDYILDASGHQLIIRDRRTNDLVHGVAGTDEAAAKYIGGALAQIGKWETLAAMRNPATAIPQQNIQFGLQLMDEAGKWQDCTGHDITVDLTDARPEIPFRIQLRNQSQVEYHVALYHLSPAYSINKQSPDTDASVLRNGQPIALLCNPPKEPLTLMLANDDVNEETETFTLVYSLFPFQDYFVDESRELPRKIVTLDATRAKGIGGSKKSFRKDWDAQTLRIRIVRNGQQLEKGKAFDNGMIAIGTQTGFKAKVTVTPVSSNAKSLSPALELQSLFDSDAFTFLPVAVPTRGAPVHTVVELTGLKDEASLHEQPLELTVRQPVGEDEAVIAVTMQNGVVVPLGFLESDEQGGQRIMIHHAPGDVDPQRAAGKSPCGRCGSAC